MTDRKEASTLSDAEIRQIFLASGFKLKTQPNGTEDLNAYVYTAARALESRLAVGQPVAWLQRHGARVAYEKNHRGFMDWSVCIEARYWHADTLQEAIESAMRAHPENAAAQEQGVRASGAGPDSSYTPSGLESGFAGAPVAAAPDRPQEPQGDFDAARDCIATFREVCKAVNETPMLQSMLYDLDLMPEQTMCDAVQWNRTCRVAEVVVNHLGATEQKSPDRLAQEIRALARTYRQVDAMGIDDAWRAMSAAIDRLAVLPQECAAVLMELVDARQAWLEACLVYSNDDTMPAKAALTTHRAIKDRLDAAWAAARALCDRLEKT